MSLMEHLVNVEKHWQADSEIPNPMRRVGGVTTPLQDRVSSLNKMKLMLEGEKKASFLYSLVLTAATVALLATASTVSNVFGSILLFTVAAVVGTLGWDCSNLYFGMKTVYQIVEQFSDTLLAGRQQVSGNTSYLQRSGWSRNLQFAKQLFSNLVLLDNPLSKPFPDTGLEIVPVIT